MKELLDIIQEEAEIMNIDSPSGKDTQRALNTAAQKIGDSGVSTVLTPTEKEAVKHALQDVGELYLFAGTSSGFDVESKAQEIEHQSRGQKARTQAATLGVYL